MKNDSTPRLARMLTIGEVANYLRVHPTTIYRLIKRGELPGFKIGDNWRIGADDLERWRQQKIQAQLRAQSA